MSEESVCAKCGSAKIIPRVYMSETGPYNTTLPVSLMLHENPDAMFFKETFRSGLTARVCGGCGYMELYAEQPGDLYAAHERSKQPRD